MHAGNVVSMFDDACCGFDQITSKSTKFGKPSGPTRGLVLKLNLSNHTGSLVSQYPRAKNFNAAFLGSTQLLPGGNVALGWGSPPFFSEDSSKGKVLLDAFWPTPDQSYRVYVENWVGIPYFPPSGAVRNNGGKATVYASWDGDTQVVGWRVLAGSSAQSLKSVATKAKSGFETTIPLSSTYKAYEVQALGPKGEGAGHVQGVPDAELQQRAARRLLSGLSGSVGGTRGESGMRDPGQDGVEGPTDAERSEAHKDRRGRLPGRPVLLRRGCRRREDQEEAQRPRAEGPERSAARVRVPDPERPLRVARDPAHVPRRPASQLGTISVTGSSSGVHTGTIAADSDGDGAALIPSTPFTPGETVTVSTSLNIEGSGNGSYAFGVATPAGTIPPAKRPAAPRVPGDVWAFHSRPDLAPAAVTITKRDPAATGDIFLAPQIGPVSSRGPS